MRVGVLSAVLRLRKRDYDDTSLAEKVWKEPSGGPKRRGPKKLQQGDRGQPQGASEGRGGHSREVKTEGELPSKNGKRGRPVGKGRKEDKAKVKS